MKLSELSGLQKQHLVWRLDHKSDHSAKIHARKVINFTLNGL
jgi:hypothetical protein